MNFELKTKDYVLNLEGNKRSCTSSRGGASGADYRVSWFEGIGVLKRENEKIIFKFETQECCYLPGLDSLFNECYDDRDISLRKNKFSDYSSIPSQNLSRFHQIILDKIILQLEKQKDKDISQIYFKYFRQSELARMGLMPDEKDQWWFSF
jgi:hypothetical protein